MKVPSAALIVLLAAAALVLASSPAPAQSWSEFYASASSLEGVTAVRRNAQFKISDARQFQEHPISLGVLTQVFDDSATARGYRPGSGDEVLRPLQANVTVAFLGFVRTGGGRWSGKAVLNVQVNDPNQVLPPTRFTVTADELFERGRLSPERMEAWGGTVVRLATTRVLGQMEGLAVEGGKAFRQVTAFGKAPAARQENSEARNAAVLDALRSGTARAWGLHVESITQMVDLADVTEVTRATGRGLVVHYELDEAQTRTTDDGFFVVLVQAVVANPINSSSGR